MKETDLAKRVVNWLADQHWDVYQEVQFRALGSIADIVAVRDGIIWIVECKVAYGLAVLGQAAAWDVHYRSVAIPMSREGRDYFVARDFYRVGVLEVHECDDGYSSPVKVVIDAPLFLRKSEFKKRWLRQNHIQNQLACLTPLHKTFAPAGSNHHDHLTPYKQTMMDVRKVVEANPGCTVKDLFEQIGRAHYASRASFQGNLIKALMDFEKDWCRVDTSSRPYRMYLREA